LAAAALEALVRHTDQMVLLLLFLVSVQLAVVAALVTRARLLEKMAALAALAAAALTAILLVMAVLELPDKEAMVEMATRPLLVQTVRPAVAAVQDKLVQTLQASEAVTAAMGQQVILLLVLLFTTQGVVEVVTATTLDALLAA
jgi:hypothetical protein